MEDKYMSKIKRNIGMKEIMFVFIAILLPCLLLTAEDGNKTQDETPAFQSLTQSIKDNKYLFVLVSNGKTNEMVDLFNKAKTTLSEKVLFTEINIADNTEEKFIKQFGIDKLESPAIVAIAPAGVVTKVFTKQAKAEELKDAFASPVTIELLKATRDNKYLFVLFFKAERNGVPIPIGDKTDSNTSAMSEVFNKAKITYSDKAVFTEINVADKSEERFIKRFEVNKVAKPLILAIAPGEIVTKGFIKKVKQEEIGEAFVTPKTLETLKANKDKKLIIMVFNNPKLEGSNKAETIVNSVAKEMSSQTPLQVIIVDPADGAEKNLLARAAVSADIKKPVVVVMQDGTLKGTIDFDKLTANALKDLITKSCGADCGPSG